MPFKENKGIAHIALILFAVVGILTFLLFTSASSFKNNLFSSLFPKPASKALTISSDLSGLRVQGNMLVNGAGQPVKLTGVNLSGTEYACQDGWGFSESPMDQNTVDALKSWKINQVRIVLNERCWLGLVGETVYMGATYRDAITNWVNLLTSNGLVVHLSLIWVDPPNNPSGKANQYAMPDRAHSPNFWTSVANIFKNNDKVTFGLYGEPHPGVSADADYICVRDGGWCSGLDWSYEAAGMQELINAIRNTGATNVITVSGTMGGTGYPKYLQFKPIDSLNNIMAEFHPYPFGWYFSENDWDTYWTPILLQMPIYLGEFGHCEGRSGLGACTSVNSCEPTIGIRAAKYLDTKTIGQYTGWTWNKWGDCALGLISDYNGTPGGPWGQTVKDFYASLVNYTPPSSATPVPTSNPSILSVYDDILGSGWENWSYSSTVNLSDTTSPYSGTKNISWKIDAAWGGLQLGNSGGFNTGGFNSFTFALKPSATVSLDIEFYDMASTRIYKNSLSNLGGLPTAGTYKEYDIPLTTLNAVNKTIYKINIMDNTGAIQPLIYIDAVGFKSAPQATSTSTPVSKTGDINGDNSINIIDLSILLSKWDSSDTSADISKDGKVSIIDLSVLLSNWGK